MAATATVDRSTIIADHLYQRFEIGAVPEQAIKDAAAEALQTIASFFAINSRNDIKQLDPSLIETVNIATSKFNRESLLAALKELNKKDGSQSLSLRQASDRELGEVEPVSEREPEEAIEEIEADHASDSESEEARQTSASELAANLAMQNKNQPITTTNHDEGSSPSINYYEGSLSPLSGLDINY